MTFTLTISADSMEELQSVLAIPVTAVDCAKESQPLTIEPDNIMPAMEQVTNDELITTARAVADRAGSKTPVKVLLDKYKVSNITQVPKEQRAGFLSELKELLNA